VDQPEHDEPERGHVEVPVLARAEGGDVLQRAEIEGVVQHALQVSVWALPPAPVAEPVVQLLPCHRHRDGRDHAGGCAERQVVPEQRERHQQHEQQHHQRRGPAVRREERASAAPACDRPADRGSRPRGGDHTGECDGGEQHQDRQQRLGPGGLGGHDERWVERGEEGGSGGGPSRYPEDPRQQPVDQREDQAGQQRVGGEHVAIFGLRPGSEPVRRQEQQRVAAAVEAGRAELAGDAAAHDPGVHEIAGLVGEVGGTVPADADGDSQRDVQQVANDEERAEHSRLGG